MNALNRISIVICCIAMIGLASMLCGQTVVFHETFDDGNLTALPRWDRFFEPSCIGIDSMQYHSPSYACKISTVNQKSAIETYSKMYSARQQYEVTEYVYVDSMGDEAIPLYLRGSDAVVILFLLPGGKVQLTVLKQTGTWDPVQIVVNNGWTLKTWQKYSLRYDGTSNTDLFIDDVYKGTVTQPWMQAPVVLQIGNKYLTHTSTFFVDDITITTTAAQQPPGEIYFMLCSDTGTWDGLDVSKKNIFLTSDLFANPSRNAARVINPEYRSKIKDSRGKPLVFTWFMLDGSMNAFNVNPEARHPWISNLEWMQKYRGSAIVQVGDELAFHYHDWIWSDPDKNGVYHWNQSLVFEEFQNDFLLTLGHLILDGGIFPSSFRSGWHYMNNQWEAMIDSLIPYRYENTVPDYRSALMEPIDNNYDWRRATRAWVPYHPSATDYQVAGNLKGWESRCMNMKSTTEQTLYEAFAAAFNGTDQLVTLWSHLPEVDFPEQILRVDSLIHATADYFPTIHYEYCTAKEAMQHWRGTTDTIPPQIGYTLSDTVVGKNVAIVVNERLWQESPVVFGELTTGEVKQLIPQKTGEASWNIPYDAGTEAYRRIGIAGTDTSGNSSVRIVELIPSAVRRRDSSTPDVFQLFPVYPNPANPSAIVKYVLPKPAFVRLTLTDILGRALQTMVNEYQAEGTHEFRLNGEKLASGMYLVFLSAGGRTAVQKIMILR